MDRDADWLPIFGQAGNAQGHLHGQGISAGDLFLFFGWFRDVYGSPENPGDYKSESPGYHVLWGWLQISAVCTVDTTDWSDYPWTSYHPHLHYAPDPRNTLYLSSKDLRIGSAIIPSVSGGGVFSEFSRDLLLTEPDQPNRSVWKLPSWFYPAPGKTPLTFHKEQSFSRLIDGHTRLKTVGRGQEFVLDCEQYPEASEWAINIIRKHGVF